MVDTLSWISNAMFFHSWIHSWSLWSISPQVTYLFLALYWFMSVEIK